MSCEDIEIKAVDITYSQLVHISVQMSIGYWRWQFISNSMKRKAWNRRSDQIGGQYRMRKGLKIDSYDLNLEREGTPQRKARGMAIC